MLDSRPSENPQADAASSAGAIDLRGLIGEHYANVYRFAYRLCGSQTDAEDLTQQTFLIAQTKLDQVRDREKIQGWLFAVLRSCFVKSRRRTRPVAACSVELDVDEIPEHRLSDGSLDREELQHALQDLPDEFRVVVLMFFFEDLSYKEIADRLELPIGTVMSRLSRAKGRLRQRLFESEVAHAGMPQPPQSNH